MPLTADRNTLAKTQTVFNTFALKANVKVFAGAMGAVGADGLLVPAANTTGLKCVGRANERGDNTGGAAAAISVRCQEGVYLWDNAAAGDAVTQAEIGSVVYMADDHTVTKTAGNGVIAGIALQIDASGGIWVKTMPSGGI